MNIEYNLLVNYGAVARKFKRGDYIFHEDDMPHYYYQVLSGEVRMYTSNAEGKELTLGYFQKGNSFGEAPLLLAKSYPGTAQAKVDTVIVKLRKENFLCVLQDFPEFANKLIYTFAEHNYQNAMVAQIWVQPSPEDKISHFLKTIRNQSGSREWQIVPYTRQQIADCTGLRVETVIRTLMKMKIKGKVDIVDHKLFCLSHAS
ncbi:MAG TPA: Crp/Fnr family transcriptional regulator [Phnomibacter sp.]|nr:Crp/Fnr family transcriptional regulator [Phnomibacter sp.]